MITPVWSTAFAHRTPSSVNGPPNAAIWDSNNLGGGTIVVSSAINRRTGGFSLELDKTVSTTALYTYRSFAAAQTIWVTRFYIYVQTMPTTQSRVWQLDATDTSDLILEINAAGNALKVRFGAEAAGSGTSSSAITTNTWYRVEIRYNVSGNTWTCDWSLDGVSQTQHTFANGAPGVGAINIIFGHSSTQAAVLKYNITDFVASNTSADFPIGAGTGYYMVPAGIGTHVNSARFNDGDGTAVDANTYLLLDDWSPNQGAGNTDFIMQITGDGVGEASYLEFTMGSRPDSEGTILSVSGFLAYTSATTTANNAGCVVRRSDGTEITIYGSDASLADYSDGSLTNLFYAASIITEPGTGWNTAELEALKFRCGYSTDVAPNPYWAALLIEYDVAPAVGGATRKFQRAAVVGA